MPNARKRTGSRETNKGPVRKQKSTPVSVRENRREQQRKQKRRQREIVGIILIALGIFIFLMLTDMTGYVGEMLSSFFYGLFGVVLGAIPIILVVCGIYTIIFADRDFQAVNGLLGIGIMFCILSMVHISMISKSTITGARPSYMTYLTNGFLLGETTHIGGGLFGALISYFVYYFLGKGTSYLFFTTCMIIMAIVITNLSLRDAGEKITQFIFERWDQWQGKTEEERAERARLRAISRAERKQEKKILRKEQKIQRKIDKEQQKIQRELEREEQSLEMERREEARFQEAQRRSNQSMRDEKMQQRSNRLTNNKESRCQVDQTIHDEEVQARSNRSMQGSNISRYDQQIQNNQEVLEEVDFDELTLGNDSERERKYQEKSQNQKKNSPQKSNTNLFDEVYDDRRKEIEQAYSSKNQLRSTEFDLDSDDRLWSNHKNVQKSEVSGERIQQNTDDEQRQMRSKPSLPKQSQANQGPDLYPAYGEIPRKQSSYRDDLELTDAQRSNQQNSDYIQGRNIKKVKHDDDLFIDYIQEKESPEKYINQQPENIRNSNVDSEVFRYREQRSTPIERVQNMDVYNQDFGEYEPYLPPIPKRPYQEGRGMDEEVSRTDGDRFTQEPDFTARKNQNKRTLPTQSVQKNTKSNYPSKDEAVAPSDVLDLNETGASMLYDQETLNQNSYQYSPYDLEDEYDMDDEYDMQNEYGDEYLDGEMQKPILEESFVEEDEAPVIDEYVPPSLELLNYISMARQSMEDIEEKSEQLESTLQDFGIKVNVVNYTCGPVITRFELQPAPGVRVSRITNLSDDIALALAAPRVRIEAPIPGKAVIGIEIPNKVTSAVALRDLLESPEFQEHSSSIAVALGRDIAGKVVVVDITKMPHLLIAGSTGSGKSVCINTIICSFLYHSSPDDVKLIMIDPKVVELAAFSKIPHLLIPVVTEPDRAANALQWGVKEMVRRYNAFAEKGARDLARYNELLERDGEKKEPKIVIIVDELADLMMIAPRDVEEAICRIAQMGRAAGIHLIIATQRPSADIITGLIKANIPSRIAFAVASAMDSRIILDTSGADKLLGRGDMLYNPIGASQPTRVQGALVTDEEVERLRCYFEESGLTAEFDEETQDQIGTGSVAGSIAAEGESGDFDPLLPEIVEMFMTQGQASLSMIQRRMRVGYAKAGRLIDELEQMGIVSPSEGSKSRKVLINRAEFEQIFGYPPNISDVGTT